MVGALAKKVRPFIIIKMEGNQIFDVNEGRAQGRVLYNGDKLRRAEF